MQLIKGHAEVLKQTFSGDAESDAYCDDGNDGGGTLRDWPGHCYLARLCLIVHLSQLVVLWLSEWSSMGRNICCGVEGRIRRACIRPIQGYKGTVTFRIVRRQ